MSMLKKIIKVVKVCQSLEIKDSLRTDNILQVILCLGLIMYS